MPAPGAREKKPTNPLVGGDLQARILAARLAPVPQVHRRSEPPIAAAGICLGLTPPI